MTQRIKWTDRRFNFDFPAALYPEMIERLRGAPARIDEYLSPATPEILITQDEGRWSIQENAGHSAHRRIRRRRLGVACGRHVE